VNLSDAASYIRTSRAPKAFLDFIGSIRRIFSFTQERANRPARFVAVTRAYQQGEPVKKIQDRFGCSLQTINRYARMSDLPKRPKHLPEDIRKAVIADYKRENPRLDVVQIAERNSVSPAYVSKVAREENISRYEPRPKKKRCLV
jgi:uncharacterized protein YerC